MSEIDLMAKRYKDPYPKNRGNKARRVLASGAFLVAIGWCSVSVYAEYQTQKNQEIAQRNQEIAEERASRKDSLSAESGDRNVFIGHATGSRNTVIGYRAGWAGYEEAEPTDE